MAKTRNGTGTTAQVTAPAADVAAQTADTGPATAVASGTTDDAAPASTVATATATQDPAAQRRLRIEQLAEKGQQIKDEIGRAEQTSLQALDHYRLAGEGLKAAKEECKKIGLAWEDWTVNKTTKSKQYCDGLIRLHDKWAVVKEHTDLHGPIGLKAALKLISKKGDGDGEGKGDGKKRPKATFSTGRVEEAMSKAGLDVGVLKKVIAVLEDLDIKVKKEA